ncbi:MAG TPA: trehalase family glycosidase [Anaerolineales bacterium]|nr:trehalase family glycosidase [Anaerolineales bacterium]
MTTVSLLDRAISVLRLNDTGVFTKPGPHQYPHQWNWDSALIALGLAHFDLPRAQAEIRSLLSGQWQDGMVPSVVYHSVPSDYFPNPGFWQIENSPQAPGVPTTGITQPPLLATVVRMIHARHPDPDFLREVFPSLRRWHRWLHTARDADGSALACIIHPWESGTDDSPRWLHLFQRIQPETLPEFQRGDTRYVAATERPNRSEYERFIYLIDVFRKVNYAPGELLAHSPFLAQDVLFNAILFRADEDLRALAADLGEPTDEIDSWMNRVQQNFTTRFWNESTGLYYDYDMRSGKPIPVNTACTFLPLFAGLPSQEQAQRLVEGHMLNSMEYAPKDEARHWVTTTAKTEPTWEPRRYWRGPVWVIMNWFIMQGLQRYGYEELAETIRQDTLGLIESNGFREYYDARDGSGCGSVDFSWSAALTLEMSQASSRG